MRTVVADDATLPFDATGQEPSFSAGGTIGRFLVLELLGQGAMGIVLGAYDPVLDRKVAVKLLRGDGASATASARLLREARAMAKLSHPNVLAIHEVGTIGEQVFLAMEYAAGGTLREWARDRRAWRDVLDKLRGAGRGLEAAHQAGMVHRDFKPSNVLLTKAGEVRVADFGLVGMGLAPGPAGNDDEADLALTQTGALVGTPAYMAPEQHAREAIGPAADQFAFCVSFWEVLYGAAPFEGVSLSSLAESVHSNRITEPPAGTDVPGWLEAVLRRGLRRDPGERWPSMTALLEQLARDPGARRRRRLQYAAAAIGIAAIATAVVCARSAPADPQCEDMARGLAGVWDGARAAKVRAAFQRTGRPSAEVAFQRVAAQLTSYTDAWVAARRATCEATHVHGEQSSELLDLRMACLDRGLAEVDALVGVLAGEPSGEVVDASITAASRLAPIASCGDTEALLALVPPPADPASRIKVDVLRRSLAVIKALDDTGQIRVALAKAREAVTEAEQLGYTGGIALAYHRRGLLEDSAGDAKAAAASLERALVAAADAHDDALAARIWTDLVFVVGVSLARPADALRLQPGAEAAVRRAGNDRLLVSELMATSGRILIANGQPDQAQALLETAIARQESYGNAPIMDINSLGFALAEQGKYAEARRQYERALALKEAAVGPDHLEVAGLLANVATMFEAQGEYAEARRRNERALAIREQTLGPEHPLVADSLTNLANTVEGEGRFEDALRYHERALAI